MKVTIEMRVEGHSKAEVEQAYKHLAFAPAGLTLTAEPPQIWRVNNLSWRGVCFITTKPDEAKPHE